MREHIASTLYQWNEPFVMKSALNLSTIRESLAPTHSNNSSQLFVFTYSHDYTKMRPKTTVQDEERKDRLTYMT